MRLWNTLQIKFVKNVARFFFFSRFPFLKNYILHLNASPTPFSILSPCFNMWQDEERYNLRFPSFCGNSERAHAIWACLSVFVLRLLRLWLVGWSFVSPDVPAPQSHLAPAPTSAAADPVRAGGPPLPHSHTAAILETLWAKRKYGADKAEDIAKGHQVPVWRLGRVRTAASCHANG